MLILSRDRIMDNGYNYFFLFIYFSTTSKNYDSSTITIIMDII